MTLVEFFPFKNSLRLKKRKKVNIFNVQVIRKKNSQNKDLARLVFSFDSNYTEWKLRKPIWLALVPLLCPDSQLLTQDSVFRKV